VIGARAWRWRIELHWLLQGTGSCALTRQSTISLTVSQSDKNPMLASGMTWFNLRPLCR
jgi:hypothetical protein